MLLPTLLGRPFFPLWKSTLLTVKLTFSSNLALMLLAQALESVLAFGAPLSSAMAPSLERDQVAITKLKVNRKVACGVTHFTPNKVADQKL